MADKTTKLTAPSGATVSVNSDKVDELLRRGFSEEQASTKTTAEKASSSKSEKK